MNILKELLHKLGIKAGKEEAGSAQIAEMIFDSDLQNLRETREQLDKSAFELAVEMIDKAENVYIIGIRNCQPLAEFLGFYLNMMFDKVKLLTTSSSSEIFEQMIRINKKDVIIGISFPRYSMRALKALEFANSRNAGVVAITDNQHSPLTLYSSCNLIAKSEMASVIDSLTAPLAVINGLIAALSMRHAKEMSEYLETLDDIWEEYQVYSSDEMNRSDDHIEIWQRAAQEENKTDE